MPAVTCTKCGFLLAETLFNSPEWGRCTSCRAPLRVEVFPALFKQPAPVQSSQPVVMEGEASCFFHPQRKAVLPCDACGRFVCALCDLELNGQHLCPGCLETEKRKGKLASLDSHRTLYDSLALGLALLPFLVWPLTVITAPAVIYVTVRYWNAPSGIVRRSKIRFVLAALIALSQMAGWAILIWVLLTASRATR